MPLQKPSSEIDWEKRKFPLVVVAENIHSPYNIGLIIRACECFGVDRIYFSGPHSNVHSAKFRKTARAAEKYIDVVIHDDTISLLQALRIQQFTTIALEISEKSQIISKFEFPREDSIAIIIGSERHGIDELTLRLTDKHVNIRQYGRTGSLNVGMALSIVLYEVTSQLSS